MNAPSIDRRRHERKKVLLSATLFDRDNQLLSSCILRDASEGGCMLVGPHAKSWPEEIIVSLRDHDFSRKGRIVWRNTKAAGVQFD